MNGKEVTRFNSSTPWWEISPLQLTVKKILCISGQQHLQEASEIHLGVDTLKGLRYPWAYKLGYLMHICFNTYFNGYRAI